MTNRAPWGARIISLSPRNEAELVEAVRFAHDNGVPLTAQGSRTGLAGGASPQGGMILNLSRMNRILGIRRDAQGRFLLRVQPGVALTTVRKALRDKSFDISSWDAESLETLKDVRAGALFFSPDPTEPTASIGGMASCNACGARSFLYGCTRKHVNALRAVLADGRVTALERGARTGAGARLCPALHRRHLPARGGFPISTPRTSRTRAIFCARTWTWSICSWAARARWRHQRTGTDPSALPGAFVRG